MGLTPPKLSDPTAPVPAARHREACGARAHPLFLESYQVHRIGTCLFPPAWGHYRDPMSLPQALPV